MKDAEDYCPYDKKDWRKWHELNHNKKMSQDHNLSWSDSVDESLCFGWIESTKKQ